MAELVFRSICKITHADWLPKGPIFYGIGPVQYDFYSGPVSFGGKIFELIKNKMCWNTITAFCSKLIV